MATIKEIAEFVGVSQATVSRVLNHDSTLSVSDKTRKSIIDYAKKIGYKTINERKGRITLNYNQPGKRRIGIAMMFSSEELKGDFYYRSLKQFVEDVCFEHGLSTITVLRDEAGCFSTADGGELDGIIAIGTFSKKEVKDFCGLTENIVFVDSVPDANKYYSILPYHLLSVRQVLKHCLDKNIKTLLFCGPKESYGEYKNMVPNSIFYHYKSMLLAYHHFDESLVVDLPEDKTDCYREIMEYFKNKNKKDFPDAILVSNDILVPSLMKALRELKIKVPKDIGIITINNTGHSVNCDPPLTSIDIDFHEMASSSLMCLQSLWYGMRKPKKIVVPCTLEDRESVL